MTLHLLVEPSLAAKLPQFLADDLVQLMEIQHVAGSIGQLTIRQRPFSPVGSEFRPFANDSPKRRLTRVDKAGRIFHPNQASRYLRVK